MRNAIANVGNRKTKKNDNVHQNAVGRRPSHWTHDAWAFRENDSGSKKHRIHRLVCPRAKEAMRVPLAIRPSTIRPSVSEPKSSKAVVAFGGISCCRSRASVLCALIRSSRSGTPGSTRRSLRRASSSREWRCSRRDSPCHPSSPPGEGEPGPGEGSTWAAGREEGRSQAGREGEESRSRAADREEGIQT